MIEAPILTTPGDDSEPLPKQSHPNKGRRFQLDKDGDIRLYQIAPKDSEFPGGCLIPIPGVPSFGTDTEAKRWVRLDSGDLLAGIQVMVIKVMGIASVNVLQKPQISINWKPKIQVSGPEVE